MQFWAGVLIIRSIGTTLRLANQCRTGLSKALTGECGPLGDTCIACQVIDELLNETMFRNLAHARIVIRDWAHDYNTNRPHSALGYETPKAFADSLNSATDCHAAQLESFALQSVAKPAPKGGSNGKALVQIG